MKKRFLAVLVAGGLWGGGWIQPGWAQATFPRNGVFDDRPGVYAFTNATLVVDAKTTLEKATLLIRDGVIEAVGKDVKLPAGVVATDLKGKRIYPALIDLDSDYGMPEVTRVARSFSAPPQYESAKKGAYYWNQAIQPETDAGLLVKVNPTRADELRRLGFATVLTHAHDGIARGNGALVTVADDRENGVIVRNGITAHYSFNKGASGQAYPNSMMGAVALLRQAFYDADWYGKGGNREQANLSLNALNRLRTLPAIFDAGDKLSILRADKIGDEFGVQYIIKTSGDEYQRLDEIKATGASLIVPVNFPAAYDVEDAWDADNISLTELKHWELAPANAGRLAQAGIPFALTSAGLKDKKDFWANVRKAIDYGLSEQAALDALTLTPARLIKVDDQLGSLQKGKHASFIITSGNLFSPDVVIYENWIRGKQHILNNMNARDLRGIWNLTVAGPNGSNPSTLKLTITGKSAGKPDYALQRDTTKLSVPKVSVDNNLISIQATLAKKQSGPAAATPGTTRLTGYLDGNTIKGNGEAPDGQLVTWTATRTGEVPANADTTKPKKPELGTLLYPFTGLGNLQKPKPETMLIRNATVWTNEKDGILTNADVFVSGGKIQQVGKNLAVPADIRVIDGTGKHLTSGIIDEHSHIALLSINEGAQSSSAEVRMQDVINSEDANIYRQLAGGVTSAQLLHGSANAIGGQSALVKLKWGEAPAALLIPGADGFIKFALGENVKQSNYPNPGVLTRFPQSRMGVEQVYMDHFTRAREYANAWKAYNGLTGKTKATAVAPRRDIELDALAEILANKRFITCHSYVQSEINMLLHVADSLGFRVNTFTHILEGYKLADKMAKHNTGGSTFSDWWAYKMEVKDAIPYNAALMASQGVIVSINSDDAEMARRLNQEAAKTVRYGDMSEEAAWKMVTLNPATLLHLENRMGSIRAGKDADLVLWNDNPLAIYARPEKTIIDGTVYFDLQSEATRREAMQKERARIIQKMLLAKSSGSPTVRPATKQQHVWHCEDIEGEVLEEH